MKIRGPTGRYPSDMGGSPQAEDRQGRLSKRTGRFGDLLVVPPSMGEGPVRLIQLPLGWRIEKDYGAYILSYSGKNGRFWRQSKGSSCQERAGESAIARFKRDIAEAAQKDAGIARKLRLYPELLG